MTSLSEYPTQTWFAAADRCQECGAPYEIRLTAPDREGEAWAEVRAAHRAGCPDAIGERLVSAGWVFGGDTMRLGDVDYPVLIQTCDLAPCLACGRLVVGVPLLIWRQGGDGMLLFCWECAWAHALVIALGREGYAGAPLS